MSIVAATAVFATVSAFASVVTVEQAALAASNFVSRAEYPSASRPEVMKIVPVENRGESVAYLASCSDGTVVALSAETGIQPVFAVYDKACDRDGNITLPRQHPMWDVTECAATNCLDRLRSARRASVVANGHLLKSPVTGDGSEANEKEWADLLRPFARPVLKTIVPVEDREEMILPGFEAGGPLTHWDQGYAIKDMAERPTRPLYNYYLYDAASGGTDSGIRIHDPDPDRWPCGCVFTAQAAAAQYKRIRGIIEHPKMFYTNEYGKAGAITTNGVTVSRRIDVIPGPYDWDILPSNYGGTNTPVYHDSDFTEEQRELIGRVIFNYTIYHAMSGFVDIAPSGTGSVQMDCWSLYYGAMVDDTIDHGHSGMQPNEALRVGESSYDTASALIDPIRFGEPVVMSVRGGLGGHCILAVGYSRVRGQDTWFRTFMGWAGRGDAWVKAGSSIYSGLDTIRYARTHGSSAGEGCPGVFVHIPRRTTAASSVMYDGKSVSFPCDVNPYFSDYAPSVYAISNDYETVYAYPFESYKPTGGEYKDFGVVASSTGIVYKGVMTLFYDTRRTKRVQRRFGASSVEDNLAVPTWWVYVGSYSPENHVFRAPDAYDLQVMTTESHAFGFDYGTPQMIQTAQREAFNANKPLLIITGADGVYDATASALKRGDAASLVPSFVTFFIDRRYDNPGILDGTNSIMVADPFSLDPVSYAMWSSDAGSRISYGSFSDPLDIVKTLQRGLRAYSGLDPARPNVYGIPWYTIPAFDSNPKSFPDATYLSVDEFSARGFTSVRSSSAVSLARSFPDRQHKDTSILYFDFTEAPLSGIGEYAFGYFTKLATISGIPRTVTSLPQFCFIGCYALKDLSGWPEWISDIPIQCFYECKSLRDLTTLPDTVTSLGNLCFCGCVGLESTDGISQVTNMGTSVFALTGVDPPLHEFKIVNWPAAVTVVPRGTFNLRNNLKTLDGLPDSITELGESAFLLAGVESARIPASVRTIGQSCFRACNSLTIVDFRNVVDFTGISFGQRCFEKSSSASDVDVGFYVPVTTAEMNGMDVSGWGLSHGHVVFHCTDGDISY